MTPDRDALRFEKIELKKYIKGVEVPVPVKTINAYKPQRGQRKGRLKFRSKARPPHPTKNNTMEGNKKARNVNLSSIGLNYTRGIEAVAFDKRESQKQNQPHKHIRFTSRNPMEEQ